MAKFFRTAAGTVGLVRDDDEENSWPKVPADATNAVALDETVPANARHLADFDAGPGRFAYVAGALQKDGAAFAPAADSQAKQDLDGLLGAAAAALSANAAYLAVASPTNAQVAAQVRALTQQSGAVIRRLVLLNRLKG